MLAALKSAKKNKEEDDTASDMSSQQSSVDPDPATTTSPGVKARPVTSHRRLGVKPEPLEETHDEKKKEETKVSSPK